MIKPYYETPNGKLYHGDCLTIMPELESVDLIVADPPYNIGIDVWDKLKRSEYIAWIKAILKHIEIVLKTNGSLYVFGNKKYIAEIKIFISDIGFDLISWIIWDKGSKRQNTLRGYADICEHLLFFIKGIEKDLNISTNKNIVRLYLKNEKQKSGKTNNFFAKEFSGFYNKTGLTNRSVIEHYFSEKQWIFPTQEIYENILQKTGFFQKDYNELKKEYENCRYTFNHEDIRIDRNPKDKRIFKHNKQILSNIWYSNNKNETTICSHPTVKPIKIIETIIKASSNFGDLILDPFLGSGTTAIACERLNRKWIGIEKELEYCEIAKQRIEREIQQLKMF